MEPANDSDADLSDFMRENSFTPSKCRSIAMKKIFFNGTHFRSLLTLLTKILKMKKAVNVGKYRTLFTSSDTRYLATAVTCAQSTK